MRPFWAQRGREALLEVRKGLGGPGGVWRPSEGPAGPLRGLGEFVSLTEVPGGVGSLFWRSGRGRRLTQSSGKGLEAIPEYRGRSGGPSRVSGGVERPSRTSGSGRECIM